MSGNNWIPVGLKVPAATTDYGEGGKVSRQVLVYSEYEGGILFGYHCDWYDTDNGEYAWSKDASGEYQCIDVTHWMDLPEAPNHSEPEESTNA